MEIAKIKQSSPGLVAKQVHAELVKDARFTNISVSEVKRACSKIAKAEVAAGGRTLTPQEAAGTAGAAMITNEQADAMVKGDAATAAETAGATLARIQNDQAVDSQLAMLSMLADCSVGGAITRDPGQYVAEVPGLAANRTTLTRGDRLGTAAQRGDTQQVKKLVSKGADPNFRNAASGVTPLGVASERGHGRRQGAIEGEGGRRGADARGLPPAAHRRAVWAGGGGARAHRRARRRPLALPAAGTRTQFAAQNRRAITCASRRAFLTTAASTHAAQDTFL